MSRRIPQTLPGYGHMRIMRRPEGFYWQGQDGGLEYGPFVTLLKAVLDMDARGRKPERRRRLHRSRSPVPADARDELKAANRAQLGPDEGMRAYRPQPDDASIEDPLHDWPEEDS